MFLWRLTPVFIENIFAKGKEFKKNSGIYYPETEGLNLFYWFYRHLDINIFQYISVRAGIAFFIAFF